MTSLPPASVASVASVASELAGDSANSASDLLPDELDLADLVPSTAPHTFTVYSKSGCAPCNQVKKMIADRAAEFHCRVVNCDEWLLEGKETFLAFLARHTERRQFPFVFFQGDFVGGLKETDIFLSFAEGSMG